MWHHWQRYLPLNYSIETFTPSPTGMELLSELFLFSTNLRVDVQLADGSVRYKGVMSEVDEGLSIWAFQLFGGMTVSDEDSTNIFKNSFVAMITSSPETLKSVEINDTI